LIVDCVVERLIVDCVAKRLILDVGWKIGCVVTTVWLKDWLYYPVKPWCPYLTLLKVDSLHLTVGWKIECVFGV
jgi:hypothetical protein